MNLSSRHYLVMPSEPAQLVAMILIATWRQPAWPGHAALLRALRSSVRSSDSRCGTSHSLIL
jgi:hypothetical protein